jgi:hypothetical protein
MVDKGFTEKRVRDGIYDPHFCCATSAASQVQFLHINGSAGVARIPGSITVLLPGIQTIGPDVRQATAHFIGPPGPAGASRAIVATSLSLGWTGSDLEP